MLTVVSVDDKAATVSNSIIEFTRLLRAVQPGTSRITRKGRVTSAGSVGIVHFLGLFLLPEKPVDVGDEFDIVFQLATDTRVNMKGKFARRQGKDNSFAVLEMSGLVGETPNLKIVAKVTSVFDTARKIVVSATLELGDGNSAKKVTTVIKLKGYGDGAGA